MGMLDASELIDLAWVYQPLPFLSGYFLTGIAIDQLSNGKEGLMKIKIRIKLKIKVFSKGE